MIRLKGDTVLFNLKFFLQIESGDLIVLVESFDYCVD